MLKTGKSRNPEATRNAILDAAEKLFIEYGFGRVSISKIAQKAGVTKSLIHHHFATKEKLWHKVKMRRFAAYTKPQRDSLANSNTDLDYLDQSMRNYFNFLLHNRDLVRLMSWMDLEEDLDLIIDFQDLLELGTAKLKERQVLGEVRDDLDPKLVFITLLNMIIHWFKSRPQWIGAGPGLPDTSATDKKYLEVMLKIFFEGITPRKED